MNKRRLGILPLIVLIGLVLLSLVSPQLLAQPRPMQQQDGPVSEEQRSWPGWPWLVTIILSAGAVAVGFKNARRTHLD